MANSEQLPSAIITSLKEEKEDRARIENIEKINISLRDKQIDLSQEQTNQLIALRNSLESNDLQSLEDKREANKVAIETLRLLGDIRDNTEDLNFDFGVGGKGIVEKILVFGTLLITSFTAGLIQGVASIFQFPTLKKLFNKLVIRPLRATIFKPAILLFDRIKNIFLALGDIYKKVGSGKFLKGNTLKVFGPNTIKFLTSLFKGIKGGISAIRTLGTKLKSGLGTIKSFFTSVITSLFKPFTDVGRAFKDILTQFGVISKGTGPLASIIKSIKNLGGLLNKFKGAFRVLGFAIGKLIFPIIAIIDFVRGIFDSLKTSTFTSPIAKAIDALLTGVGFAVGGFMGGLLDLIKDAVSWISDKLGFEGFSEFLDSFSIREMVERGFSDMAEFFSSLFNDFVPALIAGIKAAAAPGGKTFEEAFNERLSGVESGGGPGAKGDKGFFELRDQQREIDSKIREQEEAIAAGDLRTGLANRLKREDVLAELRAEKALIDQDLATRSELIRQAGIEKRANITGAIMEATQSDTLDMKAESSKTSAPIVSTVDASNNTNNVIHRTVNQNNHVDRTSMMMYSGAMAYQ
jgi:hypothetical protein